MQTASSRGTGLYWFEQARAKRAEVTEMDTTISWKELGFRYLDTGAVIGVHASDDYSFIVFAMPVGPYYKNGMVPVPAYVQERYDRAAPHGVGHVKAAGNYAAGMIGDREVKEKGYPVSLYLDAATHTLIDEFGTSNFIGITRDGAYVTPKSESILESVTNDSLRTLAKDMGMRVEHRPVRWDEIENFVEIGACGTAAVITPISSITRGDKTLRFCSEDKPGPTLKRLYDAIQAIQYGESDDRHKWMMPAGGAAIARGRIGVARGLNFGQ